MLRAENDDVSLCFFKEVIAETISRRM